MSKARLVITAITAGTRPVSEVARSYGVARSWISALLARYEAEGEAAFERRSRRPATSPRAISGETADLIVRLRKELSEQGLDAGPDTIRWHRGITVSAATISRYLAARCMVVPEPRMPPKSSCIRIQAEQPKRVLAEGCPRQPDADTHDRVRTDKIRAVGTVALRHADKHPPHRSRTQARRNRGPDSHPGPRIRIISKATGELLRELALDPGRTFDAVFTALGAAPSRDGHLLVRLLFPWN